MMTIFYMSIQLDLSKAESMIPIRQFVHLTKAMSNADVGYDNDGKNDQAIRWLQKAFDERDFNILYLATAPQFDGLRADPPVAEMIGRLGLAH